MKMSRLLAALLSLFIVLPAHAGWLDVPPTTLLNQSNIWTQLQYFDAGLDVRYSSVLFDRLSVNSSGNLLFEATEKAPGASTAALAGLGAGNVNSGTHSYKVTFVTAGGETDAGAVSGTVTTTAGDGQVALSAIPTGSVYVTSRKVYRTAVGNAVTGPWLLLATISDNTTTTYADNTADASLTTTIPSANTAIDTRWTFKNSGVFDAANTAPSFTLTDTTASAKSLTIAVDANLAQLRESAGAAGSLLVLDLANNRVGIGVTPSVVFETNGTLRMDRAGVPSQYIELFGDASTNKITSGGTKPFEIFTVGAYSLRLGINSTNVLAIDGTSGLVGIGTTSPDRLLHPELADAVTAAVSYVQRISHITSGTAAAGFGAGLEWELENASGTNKVVGTLETLFTDATDATEDADFVVKLMAAGAAAAEKLRVDSTGLLITQNATLMKSGVTLTDGAGVGVGTLTNAPAAGNPTKWIAVNDNGTTRYIPAW